MAETIKPKIDIELLKKYIEVNTGRRARGGDNVYHLAYRLLQFQTRDRRGKRSIKQYIADHEQSVKAGYFEK